MVSAHLYAEMTVRLLATLVLCGAIGLQRAHAGKPAGVRTHILVGVGSATMTLVSAYAFPGWPGGHDPTRIAAQIVSGIGFIGGGMILKEGLSVRGLTTAASLWAVAGIGITAGADLIPLAAIATTLILVTLALLGRIDASIPQQHRTIWVLSFSLPDLAQRPSLHQTLCAESIAVHVIGYEALTDHPARLTYELAAQSTFDIVQVSQALLEKGAADIQWRVDAIGEGLA